MTTELQEKLAHTDDRALIEVGRILNGGTFGKDPARLNKAQKVEHIAALANDAAIESALREVAAINVTPRAPSAPRSNGNGSTAKAQPTAPTVPSALPTELGEAFGTIQRAIERKANRTEIDEAKIRALVADAFSEIVSPIVASIDGAIHSLAQSLWKAEEDIAALQSMRAAPKTEPAKTEPPVTEPPQAQMPQEPAENLLAEFEF